MLGPKKYQQLFFENPYFRVRAGANGLNWQFSLGCVCRFRWIPLPMFCWFCLSLPIFVASDVFFFRCLSLRRFLSSDVCRFWFLSLPMLVGCLLLLLPIASEVSCFLCLSLPMFVALKFCFFGLGSFGSSEFCRVGHPFFQKNVPFFPFFSLLYKRTSGLSFLFRSL